MAPQVGLEPTTLRLTAGCSAIELLRSVAPAFDRPPGHGTLLIISKHPAAENSGNRYLLRPFPSDRAWSPLQSLSSQFCPLPYMCPLPNMKDAARHIYFRGFDLSSGACYKRLFCAELRSGTGLPRSERSRRRQKIRRGQAQHSYSCLVVEACSEPRPCPYPPLA
jgi:hypothetical protein